jgi:hypothetical protein
MRAFLLSLAGLLLSTGCSTDVFSADAGDDGGQQGDGAPTHDASSPDAGPADATADVPILVDAGGGDATPVDPGILCKGSSSTAYCDPSNQVCCGDATWGSASCVASAGCASIDSHPLECDDSADCGGIEKCCATVVVNTVTGSTCASSCSQYELCTNQSQCGGKACKVIPNATPDWLTACQ